MSKTPPSKKKVSFEPYPEYEDEEFYKKIYTKKEFFRTKSQPFGQQSINDICNPKQFTLQSYQEFVRNYISNSTNYNGILLFWGVGTGKCILPETNVYINGKIMCISDVWDQYKSSEITTDKDCGEWSKPSLNLCVNSYNQDSHLIVEENVNQLYRQKINEKINIIQLANGTTLKITKQHQLFTDKGWTNDFSSAKFVAIPSKLLNSKNITSYGPYYAEFLGFHMAIGVDLNDGKSIMLANLSHDECIYITNIFSQLCEQFNFSHDSFVIEKHGDQYCLKFECGGYYNLLESHGYKWCNEWCQKYFPESIMKLPENELKLFLKTFCKFKSMIDDKNKKIDILPLSPMMMKQFKHILKLFGIDIVICSYKFYMIGYIDSYHYELFNHLGMNRYTGSCLEMTLIESISEEIYDGYVYDLEIPSFHNYIAECVVCHNTCGSLQITEGIKDIVSKLGKKIYIITKPQVKANFYKELYSIDREKGERIPGSNQCTGDTYYIPKTSDDPKDNERRLHKIRSNINQYYRIFGAQGFANYVEFEVPEDDVGKFFSNSVFIIDEAHSLSSEEGKAAETIEVDEGIIEEKPKDATKEKPARRQSTKKPVEVLKKIFKSAEGIKLILMSATPMKDTADDLITLLDLLLINDKREPVIRDQLFPDENKVNINYLKRLTRGYVSYVRGENPISFPVVIDAESKDIIYDTLKPELTVYTPEPILNSEGKKILPTQLMKYIKVIRCPMSTYQYMGYLAVMKSTTKIDPSDLKGRQLSNIIFPSDSPKKIYYGNNGFDSVFDKKTTTKPAITGKKEIKIHQYSYKDGISDPNFLNFERIGTYSKKLEIYLTNLIKSRGIVYTYTDFVGVGALLIALLLEVNGYQRYGGPNKMYGLFRDKAINPGNFRCARCGIIQKEHRRDKHDFVPAKYLLLTGSTLFSQNDIDMVNSEENMYGGIIKVIIGTRVSGEGVDYKRIREVHIIDPWHNNTRLYQAIGRAARHCSHKDLATEERTVKVFRYCSSPPDIYYQYYKQYATLKKTGRLNEMVSGNFFTYNDLFTETSDEKIYRRIEEKDIFVKQVERALKENAVDCGINKKINTGFPTDRQGQRECDYMNCEYTCEGQTDAINDKEVDVNTDTYNLYFAEPQIVRIKRYIVELFKLNFAMTLKNIVREVRRQLPSTDENFIYEAIDQVVGQPPQTKPMIIYDRYERPGYIIFAKPYYVFHPSELDDKMAPLYYKTTPLTIKKKYVGLEAIRRKKKKQISEKLSLKQGTTVGGVNIDPILKRITTIMSTSDRLKKYQVHAILDRMTPPEQEQLYETTIPQSKNKELIIILQQYFDNIDELYIDQLEIGEKMYIGHHINGRQRYRTPTGWINIDELPEASSRIKRASTLARIAQKTEDRRENAGIVGLIIKGSQDFKVINYQGQQGKIQFKKQDPSAQSLRTVARGKVCMTYTLGELNIFYQTVSGQKGDDSWGKRDLCEKIELLCRERDDVDREHRWFIYRKEIDKS